MPPPASTQRKDDFDMAKLQKSLQQRRRHSLNSRQHVAKLTPAEIRSLNNSAAASAGVSQQSSHRSSLNSNRRTSHATPPATPDNHEQSAYQAQVSRSSSITHLPTPPHSPNLQHRRASHSSVQNGHRSHSHIHAPIPKSTSQVGFMSTNSQSRPSSATSIRSLPMYRGHEVTRTGSKNMLQRPAQEIVTNPLSMYSRPRQSLVHSSPDKQRPEEFPDLDPYQAQAILNAEDDHNLLNESAREPSPPRIAHSPMSLDAQHIETEKFPVLEPDVANERLLEMPKAVPQPSKYIAALPTDQQVRHEDAHCAQESQSLKDPPDETTTEQPKKAKKRFTFHQGLFDSKEKDSAKLLKKKERRRTVSFTKSTKGDDVTNGEAADEHDERDELLDGNISEAEGNGEFPPNPAVRPLSSDGAQAQSKQGTKRFMSSDDISGGSSFPPSSERKSKTLTHNLTPISIPSRPVYGRCACCGKLKRPSGYGSELSPVLENENIRTNFSFEAERSKAVMSNRSSNEKKRYVPIIPMEVKEDDGETGSIRTIQASIAPYDPSERSESRMSECTISMSGAAGPAEKGQGRIKRGSQSSCEARVVRFASLHGRNPEDQPNGGEEEDEVIEDSTPVVEENGKMERRGVAESPLSLSRPESQMSMQPERDQTPRAAQPNPHRKSMPKQDVIDVVGWENGKRVDESGTPEDYSQPQPLLNGHISESPIREKDTEVEEKKRSRVSGILKALQPRPKSMARTLSEEDLYMQSGAKMTKRMSIEESLHLLSNIKPAPAQKAKFPAPHQRQLESQPEEEKENIPTPLLEDGESGGSRFKQYDQKETSKHAPKLSLNLDAKDGGLLSLPTPQLGVHFARSSNTLRNLVLPSSGDTSESEREDQNGEFGVQRDEVGITNGFAGKEVAVEMLGDGAELQEKHREKVAAERGSLGRKVGVASPTAGAGAATGAGPVQFSAIGLFTGPGERKPSSEKENVTQQKKNSGQWYGIRDFGKEKVAAES